MPTGTTTRGAYLHALINSRRAAGDKLYAVADAARNHDLAFYGARRFGWRFQWLFGEETDAQMARVAPYLMHVTFEPTFPYPESEFLELWAQDLGKSPGLLFLSTADESTLWAHLHELFEMKDDEGKEYYFRFYDPRVLRQIIPGLSGRDVQRHLGPLSCLIVEDEIPECILFCTPEAARVRIERVSINGASYELTG